MTGTPSRVSAAFKGKDLSVFRQRRGVTIEEIANRTKISSQYLRAIEDEDFSKLPGGVFNVSYIRQYAAAVGFDPSRLLQRFYEKTHSNVSPESSSLDHDRQKSTPALRWLRSLTGLMH
jgi:cytoskeletal protein RodZ